MAAKAPSSRTELRPTDVREWQIPGFEDPFVQDPLTFFEKNEFLSLVARGIEDALAGGADLDTVIALLGMNEGQLRELVSGASQGQYMTLTTGLFNVLTRIFSGAPRMLEDLYLIALSVPLERRERVREGLRMIDDDTGFGILETFVEQNAATVRDFFPRWRKLLVEAAGRTRTTSDDASPPSSS